MPGSGFKCNHMAGCGCYTLGCGGYTLGWGGYTLGCDLNHWFVSITWNILKELLVAVLMGLISLVAQHPYSIHQRLHTGDGTIAGLAGAEQDADGTVIISSFRQAGQIELKLKQKIEIHFLFFLSPCYPQYLDNVSNLCFDHHLILKTNFVSPKISLKRRYFWPLNYYTGLIKFSTNRPHLE